MNYHAPDLNLHPPRGARVTLGGLVILPRMIDKCRAALAGKNGEYHYNCPLDAQFLTFAGIDAEGGTALVEHAREDDVAAEADAGAPGRLFGEVGTGGCHDGLMCWKVDGA